MNVERQILKINDPKVQKAVKEKVIPLVKKEIEKRKTNKT
jgi:hypothetical protein